MAEYYLVSQLPSLDAVNEGTPLPITSERFASLCESNLGKKGMAEFAKITLSPSREPEKSASALIESWNTGERDLRLALAKARADKMNKSFDIGTKVFSADILQTVRSAVEAESPMEADKILNRRRLDFLETLRPMDPFSQEYVFYYGLKLRLLERIRRFDPASGELAYRTIYNSIMDKDRSEVTQ